MKPEVVLGQAGLLTDRKPRDERQRIGPAARPWNVLLAGLSRKAGVTSSTALLAGALAKRYVSRPLSGNTNRRIDHATATARRRVPTPGSTTTTNIVPSGKKGTACQSWKAPGR